MVSDGVQVVYIVVVVHRMVRPVGIHDVSLTEPPIDGNAPTP